MRQNQEVFATDHNQFQDRLSGIDGLSPEWGLQTQAVLSGGNRSGRVAGGNRGEIGQDPSVSHCDTPGAVSQGMAWELRRYPG